MRLRERAASLAVVLVAVATLSGCGLTRHWKTDLDPEIPSTRAIKVMPATVGVYLPPGFRDREGVETKSITIDPYGTQHHVYHVNIGAATASWLTRCLALSFASVVMVDASSSRQQSGFQLDFIFEPVDPKVTADQSTTVGSLLERNLGVLSVASAQFTCAVRIRDRTGHAVADWMIEGLALKEVSGWFDSMRGPVSNAALVDACAALTVRLQRERALFGPAVETDKNMDTVQPKR